MAQPPHQPPQTTLNKVRDLAERAARHPQIEAAVLGALRATLPGVIEKLLSEMAHGETVRLYARKRPEDARAMRDARIASLLESGTAPDLVAAQVGCGRSQVYRVREKLKKDSSQTLP